MDTILVYNQFWQVESCTNITKEYKQFLKLLVHQSSYQSWYNHPMRWIGIYVALASLLCILAMVADLLHGLRNRKLWFPCKYFTLNAATITVIAIAIKLPMDLNNIMYGIVDQEAKLGSMSFMFTIMANLLPSLATMDSKELVSNIIALGVFVITLIVNVSIQIHTGILFYFEENSNVVVSVAYRYSIGPVLMCVIYASISVVPLLMLLIIYVCSSLAIVKSKQILESKYQAAHVTALRDQELQQPERLNVEKLKQHVSNYWIMAETGSPQFMTACSTTTSPSGVICALSTGLQIFVVILNFKFLRDYRSDYKWSTPLIFIIQFIGVILGTIAPLARFFAALRFKLSAKWIWKHLKVYKVESYWTRNLYDWKHSSIPFPSNGRKCKVVIQHMKVLILSICIGFQKAFVVSCKMISVIPIFFVICALCCLHCWKWLKGLFHASHVESVENPEEAQLGEDEDLSQYVLQLEEDMEFAERTLKGILKSVNHLIRKAEKQQPKNLMKLLAESRGFEEVEKFDSRHVLSLGSEEYRNCWSLSLVTLTTIAMSLPNIQKKLVDCLLIRGVSEGLVYVKLVEESLNATDDQVWIQKAAQTLWVEVEVYNKWLGNKLQNPDSQLHTAGRILQLLRDKAMSMVMEAQGTSIGVSNDNTK
ncbi:hypothetical protein Lser_V15G28896 [Lactuca serriola]